MLTFARAAALPVCVLRVPGEMPVGRVCVQRWGWSARILGEGAAWLSRCAGSGFSRRPWAQLRAVGGWPWYSVCHVVSNDMGWTWRSAYKELRAVRRKRLTAGRRIFLPSHYPPWLTSRITPSFTASSLSALYLYLSSSFASASSAVQYHRLGVQYIPRSPSSSSRNMRCFRRHCTCDVTKRYSGIMAP
jgi:hypothetical protein